MKIKIVAIFYLMSSFYIFAQQTRFVPPDGIFFQFGDSVRVYTVDDFDRLRKMALGNGYGYPKCFYPIGWSQNGNFAYMVEHHPDTVSGEFYYIYVINLVDDLILFEDDLNWSDSGEPEIERAETAVKNKFREWNSVVKQYNIDGTIESPGRGTTIEYFPLGFLNWNYDLYYKSQNIDGDESQNIYEECNWQLILSRTNNINTTKKIISTGKIESSYEINSILGYCKSPFEDRIATIICRESWARSIDFSIFGAHLNVGFK